nr:hypothetical protein [Tanacetum cinerariifolium]
MASKQFSLEPGLSNLNETRKSSNLSVSQVSEASKKDFEDLFQDFYDEYFDSSMIMKSSTSNVETPIIEEVFLESIPINVIPIGDEASTSHNVFNEQLEDAYFEDGEILMSSICHEQAYSFNASNWCKRLIMINAFLLKVTNSYKPCFVSNNQNAFIFFILEDPFGFDNSLALGRGTNL